MKHIKTFDEAINEALSDEKKMELLQELNVDVTALIKKYVPQLKKLDSKSAKAFNKLLNDFKFGLDELSDY
tara:strand:+ start:268 stop:480 length:213 start_codon:yes stop_codon:yes gene_type:complete